MTVRTVVLALLTLSLPGVLGGCSQSLGPSVTSVSAAAVDTRKVTDKPPAEYIIGAGDVLSVFVYQHPDLSEASVAVRPDGRISVPLIEDIMAAGRTPKALSLEVEKRLKKYVQDPVVTVIVRSFVGPPSRQIRVIGAATDPQAIPYRDNMSLLDVMIATKGLTKFAAGNRAIVVRRLPSGKEEDIHVRLNDLLKYGDLSQNIPMRPGDILIIPESWF